MMKIRNERAELERQLSAFKKKEAKSRWYKKKPKKEKTVDESTSGDHQRKIPSLLKKSSKASSSTDESHDTLIPSDCSHGTLIVSDDGRDSPTSCDEIPSSQRMQDFSQVPLVKKTSKVEGTQNLQKSILNKHVEASKAS